MLPTRKRRSDPSRGPVESSSFKGDRLRPETASYLKEIADLLHKDDFEDEEEREMLISNVHEEIKGKEYRLAVNPRCSRILQDIIKVSTPSQVSDILRNMQINLLDLCTDRCSSHVMESIFKTLFQTDSNEFPSDLMTEVLQMIQETWQDLIFNSYASHVLRVLLTWKDRVPDIFAEAFASMSPIDTIKVLKHQSAAPLFQSVLKSESLSSKNRKAMTKFLKDLSATEILLLIQDKIASRSFEAILSHCGRSIFQVLLNTTVLPNMSDMIDHRFANFVLQSVLQFVRDEKQVESILSAMEPHFKGICRADRQGVLWRLCESMIKFPVKEHQKALRKNLCTAFEIQDASKDLSLVPKLLDLVKGRGVAVTSSLVVQTLFDFSDGTAAVCLKSLLSIEKDVLIDLVVSPAGSRIAEKIFESDQFTKKKKHKFADLLERRIHDLLTNSHGCRVIEKAFDNVGLKRKEKIAQVVANEESKISGTPYGRAVLKKCRISAFKRKREDWENQLQKADKTNDMFKEIIDSVGPIGKPEEFFQVKRPNAMDEESDLSDVLRAISASKSR